MLSFICKSGFQVRFSIESKPFGISLGTSVSVIKTLLSFKTFNGHVAFGMSIKGLKINNNTIELSNTYPKGSKLPSIILDYCEDVEIENNDYKNFNFPIKIEKKENSTAIKLKKNKGVQ